MEEEGSKNAQRDSDSKPLPPSTDEDDGCAAEAPPENVKNVASKDDNSSSASPESAKTTPTSSPDAQPSTIDGSVLRRGDGVDAMVEVTCEDVEYMDEAMAESYHGNMVLHSRDAVDVALGDR